MDANSSPNHKDDFNPWASPASDLFGHFEGDPWADNDPEAELRRTRMRLRRYRAGFYIMAFTLGVLTLSTLAFLILIFSGRMPNVGAWLGIPNLDLIESTGAVWLSLACAIFLWGRWPDRAYQRRSGLLLLMSLVDVVLWSLQHASELGIPNARFGHEWFRHVVGNSLGWFEFALIADLAGRISSHLGETLATDYSRASKTVATIGGIVYALFVMMHTDWQPPIWPLRDLPFNMNSVKVYIAVIVITSICYVQVAALCLFAGRVCGRALDEMRSDDRSMEALSSRSEAGWDDLDRPADR